MDNTIHVYWKNFRRGIESQSIVRRIFVLCVYLNHAPSLPREQMALSVYITTSRSRRLSVTYLVCSMRTT